MTAETDQSSLPFRKDEEGDKQSVGTPKAIKLRALFLVIKGAFIGGIYSSLSG